ncbi:WD40 repeat domain-containing protein [Burkholderia gladioli]|uniref:WD40 repeat domain-containing protein n=1 Tax=Burkholderia gladioli TaxID=28095 RepID=UPI002030C032|nr:WD40 repeat domain-containing protein [Burkholderia gladioli]URV25290.1 WD40 repeat domain-containing protein [Burkholderia gladioli]
MIAHRSPISGIAAHRDQYVLTAGYDNQVILWDAKTQQPLARAMHDHLANQGAFSPNGDYVVTSSSDYTARLWTVPNLRLVAVFADQEDDVEMSVFHPSKPLVATASRDHRVRVYDFSGRLVQTFAGHAADVISVEWMSDADELVSSSDDGTIKRWSLATGGLVGDVDLNGIETDTIVIAPDSRIFAGNDEGEIILIDGDRRATLKAHDAGVKRLVLDGRRGLLVSLSYDRTMRLWKVGAGMPEASGGTQLPPEVWPRSCSFEGDDHIVFSTFHSTYRRYNWKLSRWDSREIAPTHGANAAIAIDGKVWTIGDAGVVRVDGVEHANTHSLCNFLTVAGDVVLTGGQLGKLFDARSGRELYQHRSPLNCAASFEHEGVTHAIVGAYTGEGIVLRIEGDKVRHVRDLPLHPNAVKGVARSGDLLFSVAADASATWVCCSTLEIVATLPDAHDKIANGCAGLGEGYFASISRDLKLRIWSPDQQVELIDTPHTHSIKCVSASGDGRYIATGSYYGRVAIYDRVERRWSFDARVSTAGVSSLSFDPLSRHFLASSYDGQVYRVPAIPR